MKPNTKRWRKAMRRRMRGPLIVKINCEGGPFIELLEHLKELVSSHQRRSERPDRFEEITTHEGCPQMDLGGCLEWKFDKLMLRMADEITLLPYGLFMVKRTWLPGNWSREHYAVRGAAG